MRKYLSLYLPANRFVPHALKALVGLGFIVILIWQLRHRLNGLSFETAWYETWYLFDASYLFPVLVLAIVNWSIEAFKWQRLAVVLEKVNYTRSLQSVLYAVSVGFVTPNRLGEWVGKISVFEKEKRLNGVSLSLLSSSTQLLVTLIFGCVATSLLINDLPGTTWWHQTSLAIGIVSIIFLLAYIFLLRGDIKRYVDKLTTGFGRQFNFLERFEFVRKIASAPNVSYKLLFETTLWSILRYAVFTIQFLLLLKACGVELQMMDGILLISVIFFYLTLIPVPNIAEAGLRGNVALFFLTPLVPQPVEIVCAATLLWFINLLIPAVAGATWFLTDKRV